ncbi:anaphase-promoting complex subunit 7 [Condylostylus longicornis]|uniref:anaphase-promoting complex subunit 7 n=1 Tax=Condylostylus longicornis TaxID=2530218 RepID=UPI00244DCDD0|nr:anaphase-promoting complex subunit 7 [Condylostylus longicornis]
MDNTLFMNVKKLYDYELYSEVLMLANILQTVFKNDRSILTQEQEYQLLLFQANSAFIERKYNTAAKYFKDVIETRKSLQRSKAASLILIEQAYEHFSDTESKYRFAICLKEMQLPKKAIFVLHSIKNKSPKMNYLLGKLQHVYGTDDNSATHSYKEVLFECPLALDTIKCLLEIGVNGHEVNSIIINACSSPQCSDWLASWIKGYDLLFNCKLTEATETFKTINQNSKLRNNDKLLSLIGECYFYNDNSDMALNYLSQAYMTNPQMTDGIMALSILYAKKNKFQELEKLATPQMPIIEYSSENWFVAAQHLKAEDKHDKHSKAIYFLQKAIAENPRNFEAHLLKGLIFCQLKKLNIALTCLKTAQSLARYRFETYKALTHCFSALGRLRHAQTMAAHSIRSFKNDPRSYVLLARALMLSKDPTGKKKAKSFIDKALALDEYNYQAVQLKVEILQQEGETGEAIKLLRKQVSYHPNCWLYSVLGDLLSTENDMEGALDNYTTALNMDPTNSQALAGLNAIGNPSARNANKQPDSYTTPSLDEVVEYPSFELVEISPANEAESETELFWSDIDAELNQ